VFVDQPSVSQTVSILRGLRERYEVHHGVRISDSALVEAAVLSDRYIADRFDGWSVCVIRRGLQMTENVQCLFGAYCGQACCDRRQDTAGSEQLQRGRGSLGL
jgi:hypothetical protein